MANLQNPVKAIHAFCTECIGSVRDIPKCPSKGCALYPFRTGKNPYRAERRLTEEQIEKRRETLAKAREKTKSEQ